jgi:hypothetical protein
MEVGEKKLYWFIIIKFVPKMPKQIRHIGHSCLAATGYNREKWDQACLNVACCYKASGQIEGKFQAMHIL